MENLCNQLKKQRVAKKLTQKDVADALHIDRVTYTGWELGNHEPDLKQLIKLADFFQTSIDYLVGRYNNIGQ